MSSTFAFPGPVDSRQRTPLLRKFSAAGSSATCSILLHSPTAAAARRARGPFSVVHRTHRSLGRTQLALRARQFLRSRVLCRPAWPDRAHRRRVRRTRSDRRSAEAPRPAGFVSLACLWSDSRRQRVDERAARVPHGGLGHYYANRRRRSGNQDRSSGSRSEPVPIAPARGRRQMASWLDRLELSCRTPRTPSRARAGARAIHGRALVKDRGVQAGEPSGRPDCRASRNRRVLDHRAAPRPTLRFRGCPARRAALAPRQKTTRLPTARCPPSGDHSRRDKVCRPRFRPHAVVNRDRRSRRRPAAANHLALRLLGSSRRSPRRFVLRLGDDDHRARPWEVGAARRGVG